jgi:hypothetical protein
MRQHPPGPTIKTNPLISQSEQIPMANKSNTSARAERNTLAAVLAKMTAATVAYSVAANREDKADTHLRRLLPVDCPKALGGMSKGLTLIIDGAPQTIPRSEFYYRSHEEIDRAMNEKKAAATTAAERRKVAAQRKSLHAAFTLDEKRVVRNAARVVPMHVTVEARKAKAALTKASRAYDAAKAALLAYRPNSAADAATLLEYCTAKTSTDVIHDHQEAAAIMRNAAKAIRTSARR